MKSAITISFILVVSSVFSQLRTTFNQYMLNPGLINPGYIDIQTRYGAAITYRKQWLTVGETPLTIAANGFYRFSKNQSVGMIVTNDRVNGINTLDVGFSYAYHLWMTRKIAVGLGIKGGYQQRTMQSDYIYFDANDPTLSQLNSYGATAGVGLTIQSKKFTFGLSLPYLFNNKFNKANFYSTPNNHFYGNIAYKLRVTDGFVFYPSILMKSVSSAPVSMSFDGHILINQLVWFGGGYRSDNTVSISGGVFLPKGVRIVYSYETAYFTPHKRFDSTHEITINYARSIDKSPFSERLYRKKSGRLHKHPDPRRG